MTIEDLKSEQIAYASSAAETVLEELRNLNTPISPAAEAMLEAMAAWGTV